MDDEAKLDALLEAYEVKDANKELVERIMAQAQKQSARPRARHFSEFSRAASLMAACAVIGFCMGGTTRAPTTSTTVTTQAASATSGSTDLNTIILGPTTLQEVML